jgi:hypothetical protein
VRYRSIISSTQWQNFRPSISDEADATLNAAQNDLQKDVEKLQRDGLPPTAGQYVAPGGSGLDNLKATSERLSKELGIDEQNVKQRTQFLARQSDTEALLKKLKEELVNITGTTARITTAVQQRFDAYELLFQSIDDEVSALKALYEPLRRRLATEPLLNKLSLRFVATSMSRHGPSEERNCLIFAASRRSKDKEHCYNWHKKNY